MKTSAFAALCAALLATVSLAATVEYTYDANGRLKGAYAPSGDAAQYVYDPAGNITQILRFSATQLAVVEFTPTSGPVGATVQIYGTGFSTTPSSNTVKFNGTTATVSAATTNKLTTTVPSGATTGPIQVTVGANNATSSANFVVTSGSGNAPTITSFSPAAGAAGTSVTINGTNFDSTAALNNITFNTTFATTTTATPTALTTAVPSNAASGAIKVRTRNGTATSSSDFLVPFGTIAAADIVASYRVVVDGSTVSYSIPGNKVVYVLFDGVQGQNVGIAVNTSSCQTMYVQQPDNLPSVAGTSSCSNISLDPPTLPLTGTYTLALKSTTSSTITGTVTVSTDATAVLGAEGTVAALSTTRAGQNGRYTFQGTTGQKLGVFVYGLSSGAQPSRIDLLQPGKEVLATSNSSGSSAYIQAVLPESGTYSVVVSPNGVSTGSWNIQYGTPDLTITSFSVGTVTVAQNGAYVIPVTAGIKNQGTVGAKGIWQENLFFSNDTTLDTTDPNIGTGNPPDVASGATYTANFSGTTSTSTAPGSYTVFLKTDGWFVNGNYSNAGDRLTESDETNNVSSSAVTLPGRPDLTASNVSIGTISVNQNGAYAFPVTFTVNNIGQSAAQPNWYDYAYLSTDATLDTTDPALGYVQRTTSAGAGTNYSVTVNAVTPTTTAPGTYTLFAKTDGYGGTTYSTTTFVTEANETNNVASTTITLPTRPDLTATSLSVGTITVNADGSYSIPVSFTVQNIGGSAAKNPWYDECYLSTDTTLGTTDDKIGHLQHTADLAASGSYGVSITCRTLTTTSPGNYTLFVKTDGYDANLKYSPTSLVTEGDETNNTASVAITLPTK